MAPPRIRQLSPGESRILAFAWKIGFLRMRSGKTAQPVGPSTPRAASADLPGLHLWRCPTVLPAHQRGRSPICPTPVCVVAASLSGEGEGMAIAPAEESVAGLRAFCAPLLHGPTRGRQAGQRRAGQGEDKPKARKLGSCAQTRGAKMTGRSYGPSNLKYMFKPQSHSRGTRLSDPCRAAHFVFSFARGCADGRRRKARRKIRYDAPANPEGPVAGS